MTSGSPAAPAAGAGTPTGAFFATDDDLCVPISDEHALAVGRAASLFGVTEHPTADLPRIFDRIWAGWDTIHQTEFAGGTATLLRHPTSGEWMCCYFRTEFTPYDDDDDDDETDRNLPAYDFGNWDISDAATRRKTLTTHTLLSLPGETPTALVDRALARILAYTAEPSGNTSDQLLDFFDPDSAFAPRGVLTIAAAVQVIITSGHPDAAEVAMLTGLGGYRDIHAFIDTMTRRQEAKWLTDEAVAAYSAAAHCGRSVELHAGGVDYRCWACTFVSSRVMGYDLDFEAEEFWDRTLNGPNTAFGDELNDRIQSVMHYWIDEEGFAGQHGVSPQYMLDVVLDRPELTFYETVEALLTDWVVVFREQTPVVISTSVDGQPRPVVVTGWRKHDAHAGSVAISIDTFFADAAVWADADASRRLFAITEFLDLFLVADDKVLLYADYHNEVSALRDKDTDAFARLVWMFEDRFTD